MAKTELSVNVNRLALLRNSRQGQLPPLLLLCDIILKAGAKGLTIHPRPDERHITTKDVYALATLWRRWQEKNSAIEFNIEGYPDERFLQLVKDTRPSQATLVPDTPEQKTSDHGFLLNDKVVPMQTTIHTIKSYGKIRVSIFLEPDTEAVELAALTGTDRIEFYTGDYAAHFTQQLQQLLATNEIATHIPIAKNLLLPLEQAMQPILLNYQRAGKRASQLGLGINAGHDLNRQNLPLLLKTIPQLDEVSIGHAIAAESLVSGLSNTVSSYQKVIANQQFTEQELS